MPHYVYLYRNDGGKPLYVGYGELVTRANAHLMHGHNPRLAEFVLHEKFTIEVAGPFDSEGVGRAVETCLITSLKPAFNVVQGPSEFRFRPLGVPVEFAERLSLPLLQRTEFISEQGIDPKPVLFVTVGDKDFDDGRVGYDLANPPADDQVLARVEQWWQLSGHLAEWTNTADESPGILIGINGGPGRQIVIASILINRNEWGHSVPCPDGGGKIRVPTITTPRLDACGLRGRRVDRGAGLAFEGIPAGFFIILTTDGTLIGGRRPRN